MAVYPVPSPPPKEIPETRLQEVYSEVPYVNDLVGRGVTWREAVRLYNSETRELEVEAMKRYFRVLDATGSSEVATRAAVDSLDTSLFDPDFDIEWEPGGITVKYEGMRWLADINLHQPAVLLPDSARRPPPVSEEDALAFLKAVAGRLSGDLGGSWMEVFSNHHFTLSGAAVRKALAQIEHSSPDSLADGPLCDRDLALILERM